MGRILTLKRQFRKRYGPPLRCGPGESPFAAGLELLSVKYVTVV